MLYYATLYLSKVNYILSLSFIVHVNIAFRKSNKITTYE